MLLVLAGTAEGRDIVACLQRDGISHVASLAGATRTPRLDGDSWRVGGFGGEAGFRQFLTNAQISKVLDATHPFAFRISQRTARVCSSLSIPYAQVLRPAWVPVAGDRWIAIPDPEAAQVHVEHGSIVFLATGRQTLDRFAALSHATLYCRQIDEPEKPFPFPKGRFVVGRPPFSQNEEERLFTELGIEWLVVKNAGGSASRSKLDAARTLGLPVLMIERPPAVSSMPLETVEMAIDWVKGQ